MTNYRALIGAKTTGVTRYIEYVDGSVMNDGKFTDSSSTPLGDVHYGKINFCWGHFSPLGIIIDILKVVYHTYKLLY